MFRSVLDMRAFTPLAGGNKKGGDSQACRLLGVKAKAAALGKDHLELASKAEDMQAEAVVISITDALASWDTQALQAAAQVIRYSSHV